MCLPKTKQLEKIILKKSLLSLWILFFAWGLPTGLQAQVIPGQSRADVETHSGVILWEEENPADASQVHQVLYAGQVQSGQIPFLALYINERLLMPIFFVSEDGYMKVMARLQSNPEMTQRPDDPYMLSFISRDGQYAYRLSTALMNGKELNEGLADRALLMRYLPASSAYAIMHVDHNVAKALGYGPS